MTAFKMPGRGWSVWRYDGVGGNSRSLAAPARAGRVGMTFVSLGAREDGEITSPLQDAGEDGHGSAVPLGAGGKAGPSLCFGLTALGRERGDDLCGGGQCGGKSVCGAYGGGGAGDRDECVFGAGAGDEQSAGAGGGSDAGGGAGTGGARGGRPRRFVHRVIARTIATAAAKRLWKLGGAA